MKYSTIKKISQPSTQPPEVRDLVARISAGGHERCASCYKWVKSRTLGAVAAFIPREKPRKLIAYVLCQSCALKLAHPVEREELAKRVESYLTDSEGVDHGRN